MKVAFSMKKIKQYDPEICFKSTGILKFIRTESGCKDAGVGRGVISQF